MLVGVSTSEDIWDSRQLRFEPVKIGSISELANLAAARAISLATFAKCQGCIINEKSIDHGENYRHSKHFQQCQLVGLDVDDGMSIAEADSVLESIGVQYAILTSKSHGKWKNQGKSNESPPCDRFRILIPCESPTSDRLTVTHNLRLFGKKINIDRNCVDPARFFKPSPGIVKIKSVGFLYQWQQPNKEQYERRARAHVESLRSYGRAGIVPQFVKQLLSSGAPEGGRNSACYSIGKALGTAGFSLDRIIGLVSSSPLGALGRSEVESAVRNGFNNRA